MNQDVLEEEEATNVPDHKRKQQRIPRGKVKVRRIYIDNLLNLETIGKLI